MPRLPPGPTTTHGLLALAVAGVHFSLAWQGSNTPTIVSGLAGAASCLIVFWWSSSLWGYAGGWVSLILVAFDPTAIGFSGLGNAYTMLTMGALAAIWAVSAGLRRVVSPAVGVIILAAVGLALLVLVANRTESGTPIGPWWRIPYLAAVKMTVPMLILVAASPVILAHARHRGKANPEPLPAGFQLYNVAPLLLWIVWWWGFVFLASAAPAYILPVIPATAILLGIAGEPISQTLRLTMASRH